MVRPNQRRSVTTGLYLCISVLLLCCPAVCYEIDGAMVASPFVGTVKGEQPFTWASVSLREGSLESWRLSPFWCYASLLWDTLGLTLCFRGDS